MEYSSYRVRAHKGRTIYEVFIPDEDRSDLGFFSLFYEDWEEPKQDEKGVYIVCRSTIDRLKKEKEKLRRLGILPTENTEHIHLYEILEAYDTAGTDSGIVYIRKAE
jgi:hypothetical protein